VQVETLECCGEEHPTPQGFWKDVKRKKLREKGFVSI
jgi:hypothetical protein